MLEMSALLIALTLFHQVMNSVGVFAGHVAMGIMAGATDMFKTALASRTVTVKYEVTQKSSVEHV